MIRVGREGGWGSTGKPDRSWWPLLAVTVLLVLVGGAAAVATPQLTRIPIPSSTRQPDGLYDGPTPVQQSPGPTRGERVARPAVPSWLMPLLGGLLLTVIVGGLLTALWLTTRGRLRPRPGQIEEPGTTRRPSAEEVVAAVDAGLSDLSDTDLDPRRAVIACWVRLEQVAAAAGTPRQVTDTPADLVTRLLSAHDVDAAVLAEFADIYRRARYTTHTVDEQMRGQARAALERLRSGLTGVGRVQGLVGG
jgi:hypothetical protein